MPRTTETIEIAARAARVFEVIATPERWSEGYLETRLRSPDYPRPESRNDRVKLTAPSPLTSPSAGTITGEQQTAMLRAGGDGEYTVPIEALLGSREPP